MLYCLETTFKKLIVAALAAALLFFPLARPGRCRPPADTATIRASALVVRNAPSRKSGKVAVLKKGTRVTVNDEVDGWLKISDGDISGYIANNKRYVRLNPPGAGDSRLRPQASLADERIRQLEKKAEQLDKEIEDHKSDLKQFNHKENEIIETLNEIELSRNKLDRQAAALRQRIESIRTTIGENRKAAQVLKEKIKADSDYAAERLVALYKLNLMGKLNIIGAADTVYEVLRTKKDMAIICDQDAVILTRHIQNQERLKAVANRLSVEENEKASLEKSMRQQIAAMNYEKGKRQVILNDIREKESARRDALASLVKAAKNLDQTIASLYKKAENDKRLKGSFSSLKGLLPMPVKGTIITEFGKYRNNDLRIVNFRSGIDIRAERGEPVHAVFRGEVLFAQWFKGYGNMMIIDHGEKYYTVYAHAQELFKQKGDFVETDEVIATVGNTASLSNEPSLYFEVRHQGKPVDPLSWLDTG